MNTDRDSMKSVASVEADSRRKSGWNRQEATAAPDCILCDRQTRHWLRVPMLVPAAGTDHYDLFRCPECGLGTVWPRPQWEDVAPAYAQDDYYTHGGAAKVKRRPPIVARIAWRGDRGNPATTERILGLLPPRGTLCELGCGNGSLLAQLRNRGVAVVGVEPDPGARSAAENGLFILAGSAELLPDQLPLASFDLVVMSHVLEHCLDPVTALTNVRRLLKPGGLALLSVPNNECIGESLSGMAWRWMDLPRHVNFFTGTSLARLCQACGLAVESTDYDGYFRQFDNEWLEEERRIRADLGIPGHPSPWTLLGKTFFAPDRLKYDSVSVTARKALEA